MEVSGQYHNQGCFTTWERTGAHWIGGRVGPRAGLDMVVKRKDPFSAPVGSGTPVVQPVL